MKRKKELSILIVEDDLDDLFFIRRILEKSESCIIRIEHAETLSSALVKLDPFSFDVILVDLFLPDSLGIESFEKIHEKMPDVPIIILTGANDEELAQKTVSKGAQDYLIKGEVHGGLLLRAIQYAIERNNSEIRLQKVIADLKHIKEELLHTNETLEQRVAQEVQTNMEHEHLLLQQSRMAAMGEMISNIAHQWRQPLNTLGILLFNIRDAYLHNELDIGYLDQAVENGNRLVQKMSMTVSDFCNFFRPDQAICAFSAQEKIREVLVLVESSFQHSHISIHLDVQQDLMLTGYPNECSQVLLNLLSNAKDAILKQHPPISGRVDIGITEQDSLGCISVRDTGGGIPADILDRIFDPYFSTKERGRGIGLYMSKMVIEHNMNGSITAKNINDGAEFRVCIPLAKDAPYCQRES